MSVDKLVGHVFIFLATAVCYYFVMDDPNEYVENEFPESESVFESSEEEIEPLSKPVKSVPEKKVSPSIEKSNPSEKKIDLTGLSYYGPSFTGYQKIAEYRHLIPAFKDFYYSLALQNPETKYTPTLRAFNEKIKETGEKFHPNTFVCRGWKKKWDKDILEKRGMKLAEITVKKNVQQVMKTRASGENGLVAYVAPTQDDLENVTQTLGGELANDALQMLRDDQDLEDIYESDELIKRKEYVVKVFAHLTKLTHGKAALLLKASQEKRENANFLMDIMKKATAGKMTAGDVAVLRSSYQPTEKQDAVV